MLSEDVKTYMYLFTSKRYYALNDRTINLLMKGYVGMSVATPEAGDLLGVASDDEIMKIVKAEKRS